MFERFTDRARRVVVLAQEEARLLNHNYVGTEHLLLGLSGEGEGIAAQVLDNLSLTYTHLLAEVKGMVGLGSVPPSGHISFTPRVKKVLELSLREALQLGHGHIGTEHLLLGLLREGEGVAAQVLKALGTKLHKVREAVIQRLAPTAGLTMADAVERIYQALTDAGSHPEYHQTTMSRHRREWPILWAAIDTLLETDRQERISQTGTG
jgi:ATP-dependent Clp protease ATP-binding subunit ClpC